MELPKEFLDVVKVLEFGAEKYESNGWLEPNAHKMDHKSNHDSMFHHLASSFSGDRLDNESGLDHLLHLACRALMQYTREKRSVEAHKRANPHFGSFLKE